MTAPDSTDEPDPDNAPEPSEEDAATSDGNAAAQGDGVDAGQDDDEHVEVAGEGEEEAKKPGVRQRLKDAEAEVQYLKEGMAYANDMAFYAAAQRVGVDPALMTASGITVENYPGPYGVLDVDALEAAMDAKRVELNIPRRPRPNPTAGSNNTDGPSGVPLDLGGIMRDYMGKAHT